MLEAITFVLQRNYPPEVAVAVEEGLHDFEEDLLKSLRVPGLDKFVNIHSNEVV